MAVGDKINHIIIEDGYTSTDDVGNILCSYTLPASGLDRLIVIEAWAAGARDNNTTKYYREIRAVIVDDDGNSLEISPIGEVVKMDGGTAFDATISIANEPNIDLVVTGHATQNVHWYGQLSIHIIETDYTGA